MRNSFKPYHVVLFVTACLSVLGAIVFFVPEGRKLISGYEFRFLSENKLLKNGIQKKVDVKKIIADIDTSFVDLPEKEDSLADKELMGRPGVANYKINESN